MATSAIGNWDRYFFLTLLWISCKRSENFLFHIKGTFRSSRSQMFFQKVVLKNFSISTRKNLCWSLFLIKVQDKTFFLWLLCNFKEDFFYSTFLLTASEHWMDEFSICLLYLLNLIAVLRNRAPMRRFWLICKGLI